MKTLFIWILMIISLTVSSLAQDTKQTVSPQNTIVTLRVETEDGKGVDIKAIDFAKLPRRQIQTRDHHYGKDVTFSGVDLREVLKLAGVQFGIDAKGANLTAFLTVEAADDYRVVFAMSELDADLTDKIILLADLRDGKSLSKEEGTFRLVVPDEKKQTRWVCQVIALKIKKAGK
ncbi:MAG TPA: molybdopterin-dependent oxidoreductase [Pyrinomonadaceae bacterium]|jgi:hypothetical protein|nr:molybdopterin-dependent oxidoreductase [Pyrinomonadaceae bacterium]